MLSIEGEMERRGSLSQTISILVIDIVSLNAHEINYLSFSNVVMMYMHYILFHKNITMTMSQSQAMMFIHFQNCIS